MSRKNLLAIKTELKAWPKVLFKVLNRPKNIPVKQKLLS